MSGPFLVKNVGLLGRDTCFQGAPRGATSHPFRPDGPKKVAKAAAKTPQGVQKTPPGDPTKQKIPENGAVLISSLYSGIFWTRVSLEESAVCSRPGASREKTTISFGGNLGISLGVFWGPALREVLPRGTPENTRLAQGVLHSCIQKKRVQPKK